MGELDSVIPGIATDLIDRFGATATLNAVTKTEDIAGGKPTETVTSSTIKISPPSPVDIRAVDGTLVQMGDMTALVAAEGLSAAPVANRDRLVLAGSTWRIVAADPIYSGDLVACYELRLRQ